MRIAVAGKGGSGKTTIAGTLARALAQRRGGGVLALDGDTNPNLALTLGLSAAAAAGVPCLPRDAVEQVTDREEKSRLRFRMPMEEILSGYSVPAPEGVRLLVVGKVGHAGAG